VKFCAEKELRARSAHSIDRYVAECDKAIRFAVDVPALENWWRGEQVKRDAIGLSRTHPAYGSVVEMCRRHKAGLLAASPPSQ
jgi:hypothetical protein